MPVDLDAEGQSPHPQLGDYRNSKGLIEHHTGISLTATIIIFFTSTLAGDRLHEREWKLEDLKGKWEELLTSAKYRLRITEIADLYPDIKSFELYYIDLENFDFDLANYLLTRPYKTIIAAEQILEELTPPEKKVKIKLRIHDLPRDCRVGIRELRSSNLGKFISVEGLVRKVTQVRPRIVDALFECKRCGRVIREHQEETVFAQPLECYKDQDGCGRTAASTKFLLLKESSGYIDAQKLELQESPEGLRGGAQPERITVHAEGDLTGKISPGDRVTINGILVSEQKRRYPYVSTYFDMFIEVNSYDVGEHEFEEVTISDEDEKKIIELSKDPDLYRKITASISPTMYGLQTEKEALALQLFGGVPKIMPDDTHIRGDIHIFLIGDPSTGKSQMLRYISELAPRGIFASGKSSSAAGLTAAATKDEFGEGRWTLEAGALVLGDKGTVCIDELDKMSPEDRSSMHEAMEQQRISIHKAGISATFQSRCAILAAANPTHGRYDETVYLTDQTKIPVTLLSRFDLIFKIIDKPEPTKDTLIAQHIVKSHIVGGMIKVKKDGFPIGAIPDHAQPYLDKTFFRKYIAFAKRTVPLMMEGAGAVLIDYYTALRGSGDEGRVSITARQLEAFIRLSEASARIRLSDVVTIDDAQRAIRIVEYYLKSTVTEDGHFDIDIVMTGTASSQRERIRTILEVIKELSIGGQRPSDTEILDEAEARGVSREKGRSILKHLQQENGRLY